MHLIPNNTQILSIHPEREMIHPALQQMKRGGTCRTKRHQHDTISTIPSARRDIYPIKHQSLLYETRYNQNKAVSEAENLVVKFGHWLGWLEAKSSSGLLHSTDHGRRAADENLNVLCGTRAPVLYDLISIILKLYRNKPNYLDHIGRHKTDTTLPSLWRVVQHIVNTEVGVLLGKFIQVLLQ